MKAVYIERCGGPEVLIYGDMPDPVPAADEVLIDIAAASVNATDWKARASGYANFRCILLPIGGRFVADRGRDDFHLPPVRERQAGELDRETGFPFYPPALVSFNYTAVNFGASFGHDPSVNRDRLFQDGRERISGLRTLR